MTHCFGARGDFIITWKKNFINFSKHSVFLFKNHGSSLNIRSAALTALLSALFIVYFSILHQLNVFDIQYRMFTTLTLAFTHLSYIKCTIRDACFEFKGGMMFQWRRDLQCHTNIIMVVYTAGCWNVNCTTRILKWNTPLDIFTKYLFWI